MKKLLSLTVLCTFLSTAQVEIFGLRTYANDDEYRPPIITKSEQVTIEFDVTTSLIPNLQIIFKHASREWKVDENNFVNDPSKVLAERLSYSPAPNGVYHYTYRYKNSFPNERNFVEFLHSGNYLYSIIDVNDGKKIVASGRFIVAEENAVVSFQAENKYHPEYDAPLNQMNFITINVIIPDDYNAADPNSIFHSDVRTVVIISNWRMSSPYRIDADDHDPETFVENVSGSEKKFWIRNVAPSNEYRRLDLSSALTYPNNKLAVIRENPDVSRYQWQSKPDANGSAKLKAFTGANSDYLEIETTLRLSEIPAKKVFLVGAFSGWEILSENEMKIDPRDGLLKLRHWARRGVYDYQYVLADFDQDGNIVNADWISLEGNDWRTINRYIALVYYNDRRFGGFDRVVGFVRGRSPGTNESGKKHNAMNPVKQPLRDINYKKK